MTNPSSDKHRAQSYRESLAFEFRHRQATNKAYSLRAFARDLGLSPSTLSEVMNGKRPLGRQSAIKVVDKLGLSPDKCRDFLLSASGYVKGEVNPYQLLELDVFDVIAEWYHFAILSLGSLPNNRASPYWIAKRLGITATEARTAWDRLDRLGFIERKGQGFIQRSSPLFVKCDKPSTAIRKYHRQNLERAMTALEKTAPEARDFSAMTMAIDPSLLPQAREIIRECREKACAILESGAVRQVYTLSVQLFPLSDEVT